MARERLPGGGGSGGMVARGSSGISAALGSLDVTEAERSTVSDDPAGDEITEGRELPTLHFSVHPETFLSQKSINGLPISGS
jgi:hypothetical protein